MVFQDRWSFMTGQINMILWELKQGNNYIYVYGNTSPVSLNKFHCDRNPYTIECCYDMVEYYCKTSNISHTLVGKKFVDNSDVVGASPVGAAPTTSSFST